MIRINLIGLKQKAKKTGASKTSLYVFAGLLVLEVVFLFVWHQKLSSDLAEATKRTKEATAKIEDLKRVKTAWEQWQAEKADLDRQTAVFEALRADQIGPPMMLQYLSYALTPLGDSPGERDEAKAQELAGWNPKWDTRRVWIKSLRQKEGILVFEGQALDHEDVAEFYRRLESSDFFFQVEPGLQTRRVHGELGIRYVEFTVTTGLTYKSVIEEQKPAAAPATPATPGTPAPGGPGAPGAPGGPGGPGAPASPGPGAPSASAPSSPVAFGGPAAQGR